MEATTDQFAPSFERRRTDPVAGPRADGLWRRAARRFRASLWPALFFAPLYATLVTGAVGLHFIWRELAFNTRTGAVLILFFCGSLFGGYIAWVLAATIAGAKPFSGRFAAILICLVIGTAGFTAFLFFLQFRVYYAQWHAMEFTLLWLVQLLFTGATSTYIFASSGVRMLLPFGLPVLFAAAYIFARRPRG